MCGGTTVAGEGLSLDTAALFGELIHHGDQNTEDEEATGGLCKNGDLEALHKGDLDAGKAARTQNLTHRRHQKQGDEEADTHTEAVEDGVHHAVLTGEHLGAAEDDTVDDDEGKIMICA